MIVDAGSKQARRRFYVELYATTGIGFGFRRTERIWAATLYSDGDDLDARPYIHNHIVARLGVIFELKILEGKRINE